MANQGLSKKFPLKTLLVLMHVHELVRRGVTETGVTQEDGRQLLRHLYPSLPVPNPRDLGHYLRNSFANRLKLQFPHLAQVSVRKVTKPNFKSWLKVQEQKFGAEIEVPSVLTVR